MKKNLQASSSPSALLRQWREERGWSQGDLAGFVHVHRTTVARWESGVSAPTPYIQNKLCRIFRKTRAEFGFIADPFTDHDEEANSGRSSSSGEAG